MFGNAAKPGGLFGQPAATSAPPAGGLFGGAAQTMSLFGGTPATTAQPTPSPFGGAAAPASGGLFGQPAATSAQPATGLFGATAAAPQNTTFGAPAATSAPASGGLFGATTSAAQPAGGLFGATNTTAAPAGGLFGNATATTQAGIGGNAGSAAPAAQNGGLFGTQNQFGGGSNLFGNKSQAPAQAAQPAGATAMSGSIFGQQSSQQQSVPGVRIDLSNIKSTSRFNDLHEDVQKWITEMDTFISNQIAFSGQAEAASEAQARNLASIPPDVDFCQRKLIGLDDALTTDSANIEQVKALVKIDAEHATLSFKAIENLKLPSQYHNSGIWSVRSTSNNPKSGEGEAQDIVEFFSRTADELGGTLQKYKRNFSEVELHLRGVETNTIQQTQALIAQQNGGLGGQENPVAELAAALMEFEKSIVGVAVRIGATREGVQSLQLGDFLGPQEGQSVYGKRAGGVY